MSRPVTVSDHAVLRYVERALDIDVEAIRAGIAEAVERGADRNAPVVRVGRIRFLLVGRTVVTALAPGMRVTWEGFARLRRRRGGC